MKDILNNKGTVVGACAHEGIKLDLGCGMRRDRSFLGIDVTPSEQTDIVRDLNRGLPFCDRSVSYIRAHNILEHIEGNTNFEFVMRELWRVLEDDGVLDVVVPGAFSDGAMRDPTHARHFTRSTFDYFKGSRPRYHEYMSDCPWIVTTISGEDNGTIYAILTPDRSPIVPPTPLVS